MQNTRLSTLFDRILDAGSRWLNNPWRRISVLIIGVLLGNFLATIISTVAGQTAELDILVAAFLTVATEGFSRIAYGGSPQVRRSLPVQIINMVKLGVIYGLFVEAFKLGS